MPDIVYLLRHAAPPAPARGRYWGRRDPGVEQASLATVSALAALMQPSPGRILSSPLSRAAVTAEALAEPLGVAVETDPALAEVDFGLFDGLNYPEVEAAFPEHAAQWLARRDAFHFPDGEAVPDFLDRARQAWERCLALPDPAVLVVAHGGIIAAWCCLFLDLPFSRRYSFRAGYAALTAFRPAAGELLFFNGTC